MLLDAGVLIALDRGEALASATVGFAQRRGVALQTSEPVVAQVWRSGARQARLAAFLNRILIHALDNGRDVGQLLAASGTSDVVDAHLVSVASIFGAPILTGDVGDLTAIAETLPPARRPRIVAWP